MRRLNFLAINRRLTKPEAAALHNTIETMRKQIGQPSAPAPAPKMSLGISRLYNLGNYEHVRYELNVEVPQGVRPSEVMTKIVHLMQAIKPKPPVPSYDYERAVKQLESPQEWHKNLKPAKARRAAIKDMCVSAAKIVEEYETWQKRRAAALDLLDALGGHATTTDHKIDWEDDDQWV